ncbi:MAG TPA: cytochrome P450, partial [Acidimicrobiia bacterium]|nr:cytochrome P450 [Acidimicrobiia bacterium]
PEGATMTDTLQAMADVLSGWAGFSGALGDNPYGLYADVRREAPVRRVVLADGRPAWIVTGYAEGRQALLDSRLVKSIPRALAVRPEIVASGLVHPLFGHHMLAADGADHSRLRRLIGGSFTAARVAAMRPRIQAIVDGLLDGLDHGPAGAPVDLVGGFTVPLPMTVIGELLGVPADQRHQLRDWFETIFADPTAPASDPAGRAAADDAAGYLRELITTKRAAPADDLLSALAASADDDRLDEGELLSTAWLLIVAGHDTTVNLIGNGLVALFRHPDQLARLRGDLGLVPAAVEEFLRYDGPLQHTTFRMTADAITIGDVEIPAHEQVLVVAAAANRDPARFADPDRLDVSRADNRHIAFGHGIHFCLGAPLARLEGDIAFTSLLRRFPRLRAAVPLDQIHWTYRITLRGLVALPVDLR